MSGFFLAAVLVVAIVGVVVIVAITSLSTTPARVGVVIGAITALVLALPPVFEALRPPPAEAPATTVPSTPTSATPPQATPSEA